MVKFSSCQSVLVQQLYFLHACHSLTISVEVSLPALINHHHLEKDSLNERSGRHLDRHPETRKQEMSLDVLTSLQVFSP
jgi:hypothetical protein